MSNDRYRVYPGAVRGSVAITLRLEGAVVLTLAVLAYRATGASWLMFAVLFLTPDLSMLGYLINRRLGAGMYNLGHSYLTPSAVALLGIAVGIGLLWPIALIWAAHIGFDRLVGYGLKYSEAFGATHLGWKGKRSSEYMSGLRRYDPMTLALTGSAAFVRGEAGQDIGDQAAMIGGHF